MISSQCKRLSVPNPFLKAKVPILQLITTAQVLPSPLQPPMSLLVAAAGIIFSDDSIRADGRLAISKADLDTVANILFRAIQLHRDQENFEVKVLALVALVCSLASSCEVGREHLKSRLLPSEQDRSLALGDGESLPHLLIRISVNASLSELKILLANLLFELSDKDPQHLVTNVGFGCASGLLLVLGEEIPRPSTEQNQQNDSLNFVTGQRVTGVSKADLSGWTDEDKQREAERLFVLFERCAWTSFNLFSKLIVFQIKSNWCRRRKSSLFGSEGRSVHRTGRLAICCFHGGVARVCVLQDPISNNNDLI